jgi:hypothetical protein
MSRAPTKPRIYIETTVVSYLVSRPSRDIVALAHQQLTHAFWAKRNQFDLLASDLVVAEAGAGNKSYAAQRLSYLQTMPLLVTSDAALDVADQLIRSAALPQKSRADAIHIAVAALNRLDYVLSWNCRHISNPATQPVIHKTLLQLDLVPPILCTPEQLLEITQ